MQTPNSTLSSPLTTSSSSGSTESKLQKPNSNPKTPSSSVSRLWRPAAQRNLRNQWLKLVSYKQKWVSASSTGRSHSTSLVNAHLSEGYVPLMDLGVLSGMPNIRQKASLKLVCQQDIYRKRLLFSYKDMVGIVSDMIRNSSSMRTFMKGPAGSPVVQFSSCSEDINDLGDGGGIPVFTFWSVPYHEKLAEELVQMFASELVLKRLLVLELLSISCECDEERTTNLSWSSELYLGEFEDLRSSGLYSEETDQPIPPRIIGHESHSPLIAKSNIRRRDHEVLQVYLTTWFVEVNIDTQRVEEIISIVGEEMHTSLY